MNGNKQKNKRDVTPIWGGKGNGDKEIILPVIFDRSWSHNRNKFQSDIIGSLGIIVTWHPGFVQGRQG
jgi:hypothetical protein